MHYTLRQATANDYHFLYRLHAATIREAVEATFGPWDESFQQARFEEHFQPEVRQIIVVEGRDVGVLQVEEREDHVFLGLIEVTPEMQNRGLGTRVINDVLAQAQARGKAVRLQVLKGNPGARRLYERLGFAIVEEREERYVMSWNP